MSAFVACSSVSLPTAEGYGSLKEHKGHDSQRWEILNAGDDLQQVRAIVPWLSMLVDSVAVRSSPFLALRAGQPSSWLTSVRDFWST